MKVSKYNFFIDYKNNSTIAYNVFSNVLAIIENDKYDQFLEFKNNEEIISDEKLKEDLIKGGFLIKETADQLKQLRVQLYQSRFDDKVLSLTIAPTSDCNFRCVYCFEKNSIRKEYMTKETMDHIINLVKKKSSKLDILNITWYGGEPLLALKQIEYMTEVFLEICNSNNIEYVASIVTNGYLLNIDNLKKLEDFKIRAIQVTVDGAKETHDKRRVLINGQGTFDKIINNLIEGKNHIPGEVSLRINVDKNNQDDFYELLKLLVDNDMNSKIFPYLGHVKNSNESYSDDLCLTKKEYAHLSLDFDKRLSINPKNKYPTRKSVVCSADKFNAFVINSDGTLYRCWDDIGVKSSSAGHISSSEINDFFTNYLVHDPTLDERCSKCKFLPICMGSCPRYFGKQEYCSEYKYILEDVLINYVEKHYKKQQIFA